LHVNLTGETNNISEFGGVADITITGNGSGNDHENINIAPATPPTSPNPNDNLSLRLVDVGHSYVNDFDYNVNTPDSITIDNSGATGQIGGNTIVFTGPGDLNIKDINSYSDQILVGFSSANPVIGGTDTITIDDSGPLAGHNTVFVSAHNNAVVNMNGVNDDLIDIGTGTQTVNLGTSASNVTIFDFSHGTAGPDMIHLGSGNELTINNVMGADVWAGGGNNNLSFHAIAAQISDPTILSQTDIIFGAGAAGNQISFGDTFANATLSQTTVVNPTNSLTDHAEQIAFASGQIVDIVGSAATHGTLSVAFADGSHLV
jgi:hypothetical protein